MNFSDFKPALRFLLIFLSVYFVLNLVYGIWIERLGNQPDRATQWASEHSAAIVNALGWDAHAVPNPGGPTIRMMNGDRIILNVFEGCNGINVMIVFLAFVLAFGGLLRKMAWFIPMGLMAIHLFNLFRILLLYFLANSNSTYFYYFHKYLFTAVIYGVVFLLWWLWIILNHEKRPVDNAP